MIRQLQRIEASTPEHGRNWRAHAVIKDPNHHWNEVRWHNAEARKARRDADLYKPDGRKHSGSAADLARLNTERFHKLHQKAYDHEKWADAHATRAKGKWHSGPECGDIKSN